MLNDIQKRKALKMWDYYLMCEKKFTSGDFKTALNLDEKRKAVIPICQEFIVKYLNSEIKLDEFKTEVDGFNKKHRLWGFKGMNGQMYFNMLFNSSSSIGLIDKLDSVLKEIIRVPKDITDAKSKIDLLSSFSNEFSKYVADKRSAPRTGSCMFFISYFWQIQNKDLWPIYYKSMVDVCQDLDLWNPGGNYSKDYQEFYQLNFEFKNIFSQHSDCKVSLWDIEHSLWVWRDKIDESNTENKNFPSYEVIKSNVLPTSYIPPVVSVIPSLAKNDHIIENLCNNTGISVSKAFEEKIALLFKMLGYKVEALGQGNGRVPDGIAICNEFHYGLIFDAKVRQEGYSLGVDDRAIREYIFHETEKLKRQGIKNVYFLIISSFFRGDYDTFIRNLKMETDIREILFMEAPALLTILEQKLRNPELDLGSKGIQGLFAQSGVISNEEVKEFLGI